MPKPKAKKIINDPEKSVDEFIEGLLLQYPNRLVKLANHNVILASRREPSRVHLFSGGGSGHEPSHAGWIGDGMLTGAVCGGIFASPSVASIFAAARLSQNNSAGVLFIVKNYTGDRLNFGMAVEKANLDEKTPVSMVVVADDCAMPRTKGITGARGVAGTVLIHKIAGAAAAAGLSLQDVTSLAHQTARRMGTLGVALDSVTVPGADQINDRLDESTIEIGLGIHGEAGMKQRSLLSSDEMAKEMVSTIQDYGRIVVTENDGSEQVIPLFQKGDEVCVLVNNLGGTSNFEMSILARSCVKLLESDEYGAKATRIFVGSFMTSFNMHGASLTILNVQDQKEILKMLDAPTEAPAWNLCDVWTLGDHRPSSTEVPEVVMDNESVEMLKPQLKVDNFSTIAKKLALLCAMKLAEAESLLTQYDTIVGDGDCGITMKRGAIEIRERLQTGKIPTDHPVSMFVAVADAVSTSMGGTSGVLIELLFRKMGSALSRVEMIGVKELCRAFQDGVDVVSLYGGATVGSRTMMDALIPAAKILLETTDLAAAAASAREGADNTAHMKAACAGRSNYLSESTLYGTPDPGAIAVAIVLENLL